eukprot:1195544-Prorocentrum_minimum.AAC.2
MHVRVITVWFDWCMALSSVHRFSRHMTLVFSPLLFETGDEDRDSMDSDNETCDVLPKSTVSAPSAKPAGHGDGTKVVTVRKLDDSGPDPTPSVPVSTFAALVGKVGRESEPVPQSFADAVVAAISPGSNAGASR